MTVVVTVIYWVVFALALLVVLFSAFRQDKPMRSLFSSGVQGLCVLGLLNVAGAFTGFSLGISLFSAGVSFALGIPGVVLMLGMRFLLLT